MRWQSSSTQDAPNEGRAWKLPALAVSAAIGLVVWRWRFPTSSCQHVVVPARCRWRAWHYGRRRADIMTIGPLLMEVKAAFGTYETSRGRLPRPLLDIRRVMSRFD